MTAQQVAGCWCALAPRHEPRSLMTAPYRLYCLIEGEEKGEEEVEEKENVEKEEDVEKEEKEDVEKEPSRRRRRRRMWRRRMWRRRRIDKTGGNGRCIMQGRSTMRGTKRR